MRNLPDVIRNRAKTRPAMVDRLLAVGALLLLILVGYLFWARPAQLHWGATADEIARPMPGDELDPDPDFLATRAVTIEGTPAEIWPWLIQMGYGRAGLYGYDIVENIGSPQGIRSARQILPQFQQVEVGDAVALSPWSQMTFYAVEPDHCLVWSGRDNQRGITWALYPLNEKRTRLVSRIRWSYDWTGPRWLARDLFTEFADFLAMRQILLGVKDRVERQPVSLGRESGQLVVFGTAFLLLLAAVILLLRHPLTWLRWFNAWGVGMVWLITWYSPLPPWASLLLLQLPLYWGLVLFFRGPRGRRGRVEEARSPE